MPASNGNGHALEHMLKGIDTGVARILGSALDGHDISVDDAVFLFDASGLELNALVMAADELRRRRVGDIVTYVVNRNINFTNVCIKRCGFCAFSRDHREEEGYFLPVGEIIRRAKEAWDLGATEVCVQAGLPPQMEGDLYIKLCEAIKSELPEIHVHGFSPEEVLYGSVRSKCTIKDYLIGLRDAGVGSLPGTSAEILDQEVRDRISPGRITVDQWIEVITTAHDLGIPTTSTIMYGHVETREHVARHIAKIRDIQKGSGGFTEFVPLSFVYTEAPMYSKTLVDNVRTRALRQRRAQGARHFQADAGQLHTEPAGLVGQGEPPLLPGYAQRRCKRPGRNPHQREHLNVGRSAVRPAGEAQPVPGTNPQRGQSARRTEHGLRPDKSVRQRGRAAGPPGPGGRPGAVRLLLQSDTDGQLPLPTPTPRSGLLGVGRVSLRASAPQNGAAPDRLYEVR